MTRAELCSSSYWTFHFPIFVQLIDFFHQLVGLDNVSTVIPHCYPKNDVIWVILVSSTDASRFVVSMKLI